MTVKLTDGIEWWLE